MYSESGLIFISHRRLDCEEAQSKIDEEMLENDI